MIKAVSSCIGGAFQRVFCTFFQHFFSSDFLYFFFSSSPGGWNEGKKKEKTLHLMRVFIFFGHTVLTTTDHRNMADMGREIGRKKR